MRLRACSMTCRPVDPAAAESSSSQARPRTCNPVCDALLLQRPTHSAHRCGQARPWGPSWRPSAVICASEVTARAGRAGALAGAHLRPATAAWAGSLLSVCHLCLSSLSSTPPQADLRARARGRRLVGRSWLDLSTGLGALTRHAAHVMCRQRRSANASVLLLQPVNSTPLAHFGTFWPQLRRIIHPGGPPGPLVCLHPATSARAVLLAS